MLAIGILVTAAIAQSDTVDMPDCLITVSGSQILFVERADDTFATMPCESAARSYRPPKNRRKAVGHILFAGSLGQGEFGLLCVDKTGASFLEYVKGTKTGIDPLPPAGKGMIADYIGRDSAGRELIHFYKAGDSGGFVTLRKTGAWQLKRTERYSQPDYAPPPLRVDRRHKTAILVTVRAENGTRAFQVPRTLLASGDDADGGVVPSGPRIPAADLIINHRGNRVILWDGKHLKVLACPYFETTGYSTAMVEPSHMLVYDALGYRRVRLKRIWSQTPKASRDPSNLTTRKCSHSPPSSSPHQPHP